MLLSYFREAKFEVTFYLSFILFCIGLIFCNKCRAFYKVSNILRFRNRKPRFKFKHIVS